MFSAPMRTVRRPVVKVATFKWPGRRWTGHVTLRPAGAGPMGTNIQRLKRLARRPGLHGVENYQNVYSGPPLPGFTSFADAAQEPIHLIRQGQLTRQAAPVALGSPDMVKKSIMATPQRVPVRGFAHRAKLANAALIAIPPSPELQYTGHPQLPSYIPQAMADSVVNMPGFGALRVHKRTRGRVYVGRAHTGFLRSRLGRW